MQGNELLEGMGFMGTSGNRVHQLASRSVLKDLIVEALTTLACKNGLVRMRVVELRSNILICRTYRRGPGRVGG